MSVVKLALRALDALVDEDVDYARELLQLAGEESDRGRKWLRCASCSRTFEWNGLLQSHLDATPCGERVRGTA